MGTGSCGCPWPGDITLPWELCSGVTGMVSGVTVAPGGCLMATIGAVSVRRGCPSHCWPEPGLATARRAVWVAGRGVSAWPPAGQFGLYNSERPGYLKGHANLEITKPGISLLGGQTVSAHGAAPQSPARGLSLWPWRGMGVGVGEPSRPSGPYPTALAARGCGVCSFTASLGMSSGPGWVPAPRSGAQGLVSAPPREVGWRQTGDPTGGHLEGLWPVLPAGRGVGQRWQPQPRPWSRPGLAHQVSVWQVC